MCGIVGYIGNEKAYDIVINGLKKLEYRGYDSSGIALIEDGELEIHKAKGRIANLEELVKDRQFSANMGIGHTRWATHGAPSELNSHPHMDMSRNIAIVHNGIIENYAEIKEWLIKEKGSVFLSETDSEVIAHLIGIYYEGDLFEAVKKAVARMRGAYAIGVVSQSEPDKMIAVRKDAPLIVGLGESCNFIASDIPALLTHTRKMYLIENDETVVVTASSVTIYDEKYNQVKRDVFNVTWDEDSAEKGGYQHFMLKEIHEQPKAVEETLSRRIGADGKISLDGISLTKEDLENINRIYIVACGTASYAGMAGKYAIEKFASIPVEVDIASEFRYRNPFVDKNTLFIAVSQSGETLDTLAALREAKKKGARILSVVNVVGSSVARESDDVFYTWAGPEIAVASTKAYTTQMVCMYMIGLHMGMLKNQIDQTYCNKIVGELKAIPSKIEKALTGELTIAREAEAKHEAQSAFFIGRGQDSSTSLEASLKLKEIAYINSFACPAGELKHGHIALIEEGTLVIAIATQDVLFEKMLSNIQEVKARGAYVIAIGKEGHKTIAEHADQVFYIPDCADEIAPLLSIIPLQLYAYYVAKAKGCDIDKPKNLAKSVTVE